MAGGSAAGADGLRWIGGEGEKDLGGSAAGGGKALGGSAGLRASTFF